MSIFDVRDFGATGNDATDDTAAIQAALDAAHAAGGGQVYIAEGTYRLTGTGDASDGALRVYSNTELFGDGMGRTVLKLADGYSEKITGLIRTPVKEVTTDVVIRDLTLDGNRTGATAEVDGIMTGVLPGSPLKDERILIERVEIHDVSRIAFNPHEQTTDLVIRNCVAHHNSWDGFIGDFVTNAVYENNVAYANDRHGFNIVTHSNNVVVRNNVSHDNAETGIIVQRGAGSKSIEGWAEMLNHHVLVENNHVYGNGTHGVVLKQAELCQVLNNDIHDNAADGVHLEGARQNLISGNLINGHDQGIAISRYPGSLGGPSASWGNLVTANIIDRIAEEALVESGSTTTGNLYSDNVLLSGIVVLNAGSTLDDNAVLPAIDPIAIVAAMPTIDGVVYGGNPVIGTAGDDVMYGTLDVDRMHGGDGNDTMYGESGNDVMMGGNGDDILKGRNADDLLLGGAGRDWLYGGKGNDALSGGAGDDMLYGDDLSGPQGNDVMMGGDGNDMLKGRGGNDTLFGDAGDDKLWGSEGADILSGGDGVDALYGGVDNDVLAGGAGADKLSGEDGNDTLNGGEGVDTLYGGLGADVFVLDATALGAPDTVKDFNLAEGDSLLLDNILTGFDPLADDLAAFVSFSQSGTQTTVLVDRDGAGEAHVAQAVAVLKNVVSLDLAALYDAGQLAVV